MTTAITAILLFGIIIMVHETGHFITARLSGIYAEEFSIGMGPSIWKYKGKETLYSLRILPIGGYVKFIGEDGESDDPRAFGNASVWKRIAVIAAGPIMNFVLAILLLSAFFMFFGLYEVSPDILEVVEGSPAHSAGLKSGDVVVKINDVSIEEYDETEGIDRFRSVIDQSGEQPVEVVVKRDGEIIDFTLTPRYTKERDTYEIGILFGRYRRYGLFSATGLAVKQTGRIIMLMVELLKNLIFHGEGVGDVMGPVGIVGEINKAVSAGFEQVINLAILITLNLGIINLIPFPALDGGRLVILLVEGFRGKPIDPNKEGYIHFIGFVVLMLVAILVTFQDIARQWFSSGL
jgi:regulator of sigma E protease